MGVGLPHRILAILDRAPSEQDPRDVVIEQQDREIGRLRDDLARHKDVHRRNDGLQRQNERLRRENEHLKKQLGAERRAGRRQAAPFAKDRPQGRGGRPGRRPGARYGRQGRRPCPARVDETLAAPAPATCPDCGGAVEVTGAASQYQEDLPPVRPLVRRFDIEVGHCSQCRRRIQGRHALQTSDALGAARAQLGPGTALTRDRARRLTAASGEVPRRCPEARPLAVWAGSLNGSCAPQPADLALRALASLEGVVGRETAGLG